MAPGYAADTKQKDAADTRPATKPEVKAEAKADTKQKNVAIVNGVGIPRARLDFVAKSQLAQAQSQYVNSVRQYNQAKLGFARNLGIVDTQYKTYLPGGTPPELKSKQADQPQGGR